MNGSRTLLATAGVIGLVPCGAILLMLFTGSAAAGPAILALTATSLAAVMIAALFLRDVDLLGAWLQNGPPQGPMPALHVGAMEPLERGIERLVRVQAASASQSDRMLLANAAILERLPDPLVVLGADRVVRRTNAAARAIFGPDIAAVLRHPLLRGAIDRVLEWHSTQTVDLHLAVPVSREVQATVIWIDPPLDDGGVVFAVLSDRTRERAAERMRADFVANASHELRTPLASLIGFIDTLRGPAADDPPAQARFLGIMSEQALRMNRLIDDLLSLSRIELTEHQPPNERVDVADVIRGVAEAFMPRLQEHETTLSLDIEPDLPPILADHDQIVQVLQNLVDNAVKYGKRGGTVRLSAVRAPPGGRSPKKYQWPARAGVVLSVGDDGPGIPRAHVPRLTERFYRVDKGRSRKAGGTGLGLAIVKHIVNRHRGQMHIDSDEGRGATFLIWLPNGEDRARSGG